MATAKVMSSSSGAAMAMTEVHERHSETDGRRERERDRSGGGAGAGSGVSVGGPPSTASAGSASASGGANCANASSARDRERDSSKDDKERKLGHRRVDEAGQVSYKKIHVNTLMQSIQLGIGQSIGAMSHADERDLLMQDFMTVETVFFPKGGSSSTPAHQCTDFTFKTLAPLAFRYFLNLFGIRREDFMVSLCNEPMRELSNPGASGSIFYLTSDDEFILKTVMHKEAEFLQKLLPGYYMNLNQNPHTLLPKFFGMYCYQCNQKNIRLTVMNNLLPSNVKMHLKFDLKGSTYKRKASKQERGKKSPTFKDLDFMEMLPEGVLLEAETYNALISTLRRDCRVLESFRIMDYSLLVGIHNLDQASREHTESGSAGTSKSPMKAEQLRRTRFLGEKVRSSAQPKRLIANATAMESIQAQTEPIDEEEHLPPGGIPARNHKGERLLLFLGIIDILQSYRMRKKLEHTFKSIIHDGDTVSVHRPGFYAHRFLDFMADKVFKKIPSLDLPEIKGSHRKFRTIVSSLIALKHSPSRKSRRDASMKKPSTASTSDEQPQMTATEPKSSQFAITTPIDTKESLNKQPNGSGSKPNSPPPAAAATTTAATAAAPAATTTTTTAAVEKDPESESASVAAAAAAPDVTAVASPQPTATPTSCDPQQASSSPPSSSPPSDQVNLPAVLWDRPAGSKTRVPPSGGNGCSARSPTGEACSAAIAAAFSSSASCNLPPPTSSAAAATSSSSSAASSTRTVVQRGAESSYVDPHSTSSSSPPSRQPHNHHHHHSSSSPSSSGYPHVRYAMSASQPDVVPAEKGGRPRNRLHDTVKQTSGEIDRRSDSRLSDDPSATPSHSAATAHGTPSRLSVGARSSSAGGYTTPTWGSHTEGTPSYTESSCSGGGDQGGGGGQGSTPNRSPCSVGTTRNYKNTHYHETEI